MYKYLATFILSLAIIYIYYQYTRNKEDFIIEEDGVIEQVLDDLKIRQQKYGKGNPIENNGDYIGKAVGFMDNIDATVEAEKENENGLPFELGDYAVYSPTNEIKNNNTNNQNNLNNNTNEPEYPLVSAGKANNQYKILNNGSNENTEYGSVNNVTDINNQELTNKAFSNNNGDLNYTMHADYPSEFCKTNPSLIMEDKSCIGLSVKECQQKLIDISGYNTNHDDRNRPINTRIGKTGNTELVNTVEPSRTVYDVNQIVPNGNMRHRSELDNIPQNPAQNNANVVQNTNNSEPSSSAIWTSNNIDDNFNKIDMDDFMKPIISQTNVKGVTNIFAPLIYIKNGQKYVNMPYEYHMNNNGNNHNSLANVVNLNNNSMNMNGNNMNGNMNNNGVSMENITTQNGDDLLTSQNPEEELNTDGFNQNILIAR